MRKNIVLGVCLLMVVIVVFSLSKFLLAILGAFGLYVYLKKPD